MAEDFAFDEVSFFRDVQELSARADKQRAAFAETQQQSIEDVAESQANLKTSIDLFTKEAEEINAETLAALQQLERAAAVPPQFRDLVSIFNPELNMDKQRVAVQRGQLELSNVQSKLRSAQLSHDLTTQTARSNIELAATAEAVTRAQLENSIKVLGLGIQIENEVEQEDITEAQNLSTEEIQRIDTALKAGDLQSVPPRFRNKPGLIEATLQNKQFSQMGVTQREIQIASSEILLRREKISDTLTKFDDSALSEQLRTQTFPEGLNKNIVTQELDRRQKIQEDLRSAQLANEAGEFQLLNAKKNEVINDSTLGELKVAFDLAARSPEGVAEIRAGDFAAAFTKEELNNAILAKEKAFEATALKLATDAMVVGTAEATNVSNNLQINNISRQLSPGGTFDPNNPIATAPPQVLNLLAENSARLSELRTLKSGLPEDAASVIDPLIGKEIKAMSDKIAKMEEDIVKNSPKPQQMATKEFLKNGRVVNNRNAGDLLSSQAANSEALNHHPLIGNLWKEFSLEFLDLESSVGGRNIAMDSVSGSFSISNEAKQDSTNLVERALQDTQFRDRASQKFLQKTLAEAVLTLQTETRAKDTGASPFDGIVNPQTGSFGPEFFQITPEGKRIFDAQTFNVALSVKNKDLRTAGILQEGETLQSMIYTRTSQMTVALDYTDRNLRANATEASLATFAFNNDLGQFVRKKLSGLQANVDNAEVKVQQLQNQLNAETEAIMLQEEKVQKLRETPTSQLPRGLPPGVSAFGPSQGPAQNLLQLFNRNRQ